MRTHEIVAGIAILLPYYNDANGFHAGAEHDTFYMYATDNPVSDEDVARLRELGWTQEEAECDDDGNDVYNPEESWAANV